MKRKKRLDEFLKEFKERNYIKALNPNPLGLDQGMKIAAAMAVVQSPIFPLAVCVMFFVRTIILSDIL